MSTDHVLLVSGVAPARREFARRMATETAPLALAALLPPPADYPPPEHWSPDDGDLVAVLLHLSAFPLLGQVCTPMLGAHLWRAATWGTTEEVRDVHVEDERPDDDEWVLRYRFATSTPPVPWLRAASATDHRLVLRLISANGGADVVACITATGGDVIEGRYGDYDELADDLAVARM